MKKIIHLSCLVLLLFTCNKIIGKNGTPKTFIPCVDTDDEPSLSYVDTDEPSLPYVDTNAQSLPYVNTDFAILDASIKLNKLLKQKKERKQMGLKETPETNADYL